MTLPSFRPVNGLRKRVVKNLMSCTKRPDGQNKICFLLTHNPAPGRLRTYMKASSVNIIGWLGRTLHLRRNHNTPGGFIHALFIHAPVDNQRQVGSCLQNMQGVRQDAARYLRWSVPGHSLGDHESARLCYAGPISDCPESPFSTRSIDPYIGIASKQGDRQDGIGRPVIAELT